MNNQKAFTLIELMVAVAIVGILAGIAYPTFQDSVMKSRRANVKGVLLGLANAMERHYTEKSSYQGAAGSKSSPVDTGTAWIYTIPTETASFYTVTISQATASTYTLNAVPTGVQVNDKCGTLTITHTGVKCPSDNATCASHTAGCW